MATKTLFTSRDRTTIACTKHGAGAPLVLVHGTAADGSRWARVLPLLQARFTVYACDRRGRGASGDATEYSLEREAEDLGAVVNGIGEPVTLVGHSFGAICALEAALRAAPLRTLVLYEAPIGLPVGPDGIVDRLAAMLASGDRERVVVTFLREVVRLADDQLTALRAQDSWPARVAAAHTIPRELRAQEAYEPGLDAFRTLAAPVLLLLGGVSPPAVASSTKRLAGMLPAARVVTMPGQHHIAMDAAPELFAGELFALQV